MRLLWGRQPVARLLEDAATPAPLRARLELVERVRGFGAELGLDVDGQYTSLVEVPGEAVVTTVVGTRPGEIEPAGFWFPVVGRLPYKGFFDPDRARAEAERLAASGLDTCVSPVRAYSTLGWFDDPLTTPLLRLEDGLLVEVLLHELTHATVFVAGDADFNEGLATFVGEEAAIRFWEAASGPDGEDARRERARVADDRRIADDLARFRGAVADLYAEFAAGPERDRRRAGLEAETRERLAALPLGSRDAAKLAAAVRLNDACQALVGAYQSDLPAYAQRLAELDGDLTELLAAAREAAEAPEPRCALLGICASPKDPDS